MLNTQQRVIIVFLAFALNNVYGQSDEIKVISIKNALELSADEFSGTDYEFYESEIKKAYYNWIYYINRLRILTEKKTLINDLTEISELKLKAGEISITEKALYESEYLKIELHCVSARNNLLIAEDDLKRALSVNNDILPENDSLVKYDLPDGITDKLINDTLNVYDHESYMLHKEFDNLKLRLKMYDEQLLFYKKVILYLQQTVSAIRQRYKSEDIEYSDYVNVVNDALDFNLDYLSALNQYNQTAIKFETYLKLISD